MPRVSAKILIVGDPPRRAGLERRIVPWGYAAATCDADGLPGHLEQSSAPAAIVLCVADGQIPLCMARLRRNRISAAVPVILCGSLGGAVRDLADVLDLGADHFLEEPVRDEPLRAALDALAGPGHPPPERVAEVDRVFSDAAVGRALEPEVRPFVSTLPRVSAPRPASPAGEVSLGLGGPPGELAEEGRSAPREPAEEGEGAPRAEGDAEAGEGRGKHGDPVASDVAAHLPHEPRSIEPGLRLHGVEGNASEPWTSGEDVGRAGTTPVEPLLEGGPEGGPEVPRMVLDHARRKLPLPGETGGSLQDVEVPRLLWQLRSVGFHGRLRLERGHVDRDVWFTHGRWSFASTEHPRDRLVDYARRIGKLTDAQYDRARRWPAEAAAHEARRLVEAGMLKAEEFTTLLGEHAVAVLQSTLPWNRGTWSLDARWLVEAPIDAPCPLEQVLLLGVSEWVELAQLWSWLGGPQRFVRWRGGPVSPAALSEEYRGVCWLDGIDGKTSLATLTASLGPGALEACLALVYVLEVLGAVELSGVPHPPAAETSESIDRARISERLRLARCADYFELLGLPRTAGRLEVRRAFKALEGAYRVDLLAAPLRDTLEDAVAEIRHALAEACEILSDDALRTAYVAHLAAPDDS